MIVIYHSLLTSIVNNYLPVQKCPPKPGLHNPHLPVVLSHTFSSKLLPHLHSDLQKLPKYPGLHRLHLPSVWSHPVVEHEGMLLIEFKFG